MVTLLTEHEQSMFRKLKNKKKNSREFRELVMSLHLKQIVHKHDIIFFVHFCDVIMVSANKTQGCWKVT